ncbi:MAG: hypothetical protein LBJ01_06940, partial [Tannerella sp.]|nr:hypothetical protein [Tannerella sp.]
MNGVYNNPEDIIGTITQRDSEQWLRIDGDDSRTAGAVAVGGASTEVDGGRPKSTEGVTGGAGVST